jgi:HSP20 family protein
MIARRWDPFTVLARLDDEFDELVRRSWGPVTARTFGFIPAVDMTATGSDVVLTLELPGVDIDKDVDIEVHDGRLTISGQRRDEHESSHDKGRVLVKELRYGSFRREFALPEGVGADDVTAEYDKGLLQIRVRNVTRPVEAARKISVKPGISTPKTISGAGED